MIKRGTQNVTKLYRGTQEVKRVYRGTDIVYEAEAPEPSTRTTIHWGGDVTGATFVQIPNTGYGYYKMSDTAAVYDAAKPPFTYTQIDPSSGEETAASFRADNEAIGNMVFHYNSSEPISVVASAMFNLAILISIPEAGTYTVVSVLSATFSEPGLYVSNALYDDMAGKMPDITVTWEN